MNIELMQQQLKKEMGKSIQISFDNLYCGSDKIEKIFLDKDNNVCFYINGKRKELKDVDFWTAQYMIEHLELTNKMFARN